MIDHRDVEIRFHSPEDPVLGPRGEEAERLAYPEGQFAREIEYAGRKWSFHMELMRGPGNKEEWDRPELRQTGHEMPLRALKFGARRPVP